MRKLTLLLTLIATCLHGQVILNYGDAEIINGGLGVGNSTLTQAGNIRYNGTNFQGFNGTSWLNLDKQGSSDGDEGDIQLSDGSGLFVNSDGIESGSEYNFNGVNLKTAFANGSNFNISSDVFAFSLNLLNNDGDAALNLRENSFVLDYTNYSGSNGFNYRIGSAPSYSESMRLVIEEGSKLFINEVDLINERKWAIKLIKDNANTTDEITLDTAIFSVSFDGEELFSLNDSAELNFKDKFIRFNEEEGMFEFSTGKGDVVWQGALEDLVQVYNATADTIPNFRPVYFNGVYNEQLPTIDYAVASDVRRSINIEGITTVSIPPNEWGYICERGYVRGVNTSNLSITRPGFLGDSIIIDSLPPHPSIAKIMGSPIKIDNDSGIFYVERSAVLDRPIIASNQGFTSQGIGAGTYYNYGFYDAATTSITLTQASSTTTYGEASRAHMSHPFAVAGGVGTVTGAGRVALVTFGTSIDDDGVITPFYTDTLIADITTLALNDYCETAKYNGTIIYSLVVAEGTPTAYSVTFNRGLAKYDDSFNRDFYLTGIEVIGLAAANDGNFNVELLHHKSTGWTYASSGFVPGDGIIASFTDMFPEVNLANGKTFAWKRLNINTFIKGSESEGYLVRITTGRNNSVQSMNTKVVVAVDKIAGFSEPN